MSSSSLFSKGKIFFLIDIFPKCLEPFGHCKTQFESTNKSYLDLKSNRVTVFVLSIGKGNV